MLTAMLTAMPKASTIDQRLSAVSISLASETKKGTAMPNTTPSRPPVVESTAVFSGLVSTASGSRR